MFLAADSATPARLVDEGEAPASSRVTYAIGQLVLWSADKSRVDADGKVLINGQFHHLALAQPKLAPYGLAAQQVLEKLKLWERLQDKLVMGENVSQTRQFIESGNAELGFIAHSQVREQDGGSYWMVPPAWYAPITQQALLLKAAINKSAAIQFWHFLKTPAAQAIIRDAGYGLPDSGH